MDRARRPPPPVNIQTTAPPPPGRPPDPPPPPTTNSPPPPLNVAPKREGVGVKTGPGGPPWASSVLALFLGHLKFWSEFRSVGGVCVYFLNST